MAKLVENLVFDRANTIYSKELSVMYGYINFGNHLAYDKLFTLLQDVRISFLAEHQMSEDNLVNNVGWFVIEAYSQYKKEAKFQDQLIVYIYFKKLNKKILDIYYEVEDKNSEAIVANAITRHICFDTVAEKTCQLPSELEKLIGN